MPGDAHWHALAGDEVLAAVEDWLLAIGAAATVLPVVAAEKWLTRP